jgi:DNA gyrase subunit A
MLISDQGTLVRTRAAEVSTVGRNTQGVTLIRTGADEHVVGLQRIDEIEELIILDEDTAEADAEVVTADAASPSAPESDAESNDDSDANE